MRQGWRTAPVCEQCWIEHEGEHEEREIDGVIHTRLISLRMPIRLKPEVCAVETCSYCGWPTFVGIFQRRFVWVEGDGEGEIIPDDMRGLDLPPAVDQPRLEP